MTHGANYRLASESFLSLGKKMPKEWVNPPMPEAAYGFIWEGFFDLNSERSFGFSAGPIPFSKIVWYAKEHLELCEISSYIFIETIKQLDSFYLSKLSEKNNETKSTGKKPKKDRFGV